MAIQLVGGGTPDWTDASVTINGGGSLTFDVEYSRYIIMNKLLVWQFRITQTAAGSGTTSLGIEPPVAGVTFLESSNAGLAVTEDIANNNQYNPLGVIVDTGNNELNIYRNLVSQSLLQGGQMTGNNNVAFIACTICTGIA